MHTHSDRDRGRARETAREREREREIETWESSALHCVMLRAGSQPKVLYGLSSKPPHATHARERVQSTCVENAHTRRDLRVRKLLSLSLSSAPLSTQWNGLLPKNVYFQERSTFGKSRYRRARNLLYLSHLYFLERQPWQTFG